MKSLLCELDGSVERVSLALKESETFAAHCNLSKKQNLHLRLLTEELVGMVGGVLDVHEGTFWLEQDGPHYLLHLMARAEVGDVAKKRLLNASTTGVDQLHKGIKGKIRQALEWILLPSDTGVIIPAGFNFAGAAPALPSADSLRWSLEQYRKSLDREEKAQAWDELESSVLATLADDVRVGVLSDRVEITIQKTF